MRGNALRGKGKIRASEGRSGRNVRKRQRTPGGWRPGKQFADCPLREISHCKDMMARERSAARSEERQSMRPTERRNHAQRAQSAPILLSRLAQPDAELEVAIDVEVVAPPPADAPIDFRERLALALRTTDARLLDAAERGYQGVWPDVHAYLCERLGQTRGLPPGELLASDTAELLREHEGSERLVWSIPVTDAQVMIFELPRASSRATAIASLLSGRESDAPTLPS